MKKTVLTFGLISGAILSVMMLVTIPFVDVIGSDRGEIIGYTTMVLAFLLIYFGVRSYRDNVAGGPVSFGRAFAIGMLITAVASACYVATWEAYYHKFAPDFVTKMKDASIAKVQRSGGSPEEIQRKTAEVERSMQLYANPIFNAAVSFLEPLPVGLLLSLVSAGVLRRKRESTAGSVLAASTTS